MPRLFIAINGDDATKARLLSVQDGIKAQSLKGNFSRPENLHLTLVFLGETPAEQIPSICAVITESVQSAASFALTFSQTGCFKQGNKELWCIHADPAGTALAMLKNLRQRLTGGLGATGIAFDSKPFKPHITLGREITHNDPIAVKNQPIPFPVNRISLMQSERINGVLTYTEIFGAELPKNEK